MGRIPDDIVDEVQAKVNIVDVVSAHIPLKKAGRNFKANCPFHNEKTPSFVVNPDKQIFHCFGCGAGGNAFGFLMKYSNLSFPEALRALADKAGIRLPDVKIDHTSVSRLSLLYRFNQVVAEYYYNNLLNAQLGRRALSYLTSRGIKRELIDKFKIGYAPPGWDGLLKFAKSKGYSEEAMERLGLILPGKEKGHYDRFRDRVIYPIFDLKSRVVGFGARVLDDGDSPKYLNSPETEIYVKGSNLYGLNFAIPGIRTRNDVIVVEGYMDSLSLFQHGVENVVASLGTALTVDQIRLMKKFAKSAVMVFDGDMAGEGAMLRGLDLFIEESFEVKIVELPKGMDPDDYIKKNSRDAFMGMVDNAKGLFDYKVSMLEKRFDGKSAEGNYRIAQEMLPSIAKISSAILKAEYLKRLAERLNMKESDIREEMKRARPDSSYAHKQGIPLSAKPVNLDPAEKMLLGLMLEDSKRLDTVIAELNLDDFMDPRIKMFIEYMYRRHSKGSPVEPAKMMNELDGEDAGSIISEIACGCGTSGEGDRALKDCIGRIKERKRKFEIDKLKMQIKRAQDENNEEKAMMLLSKCNQLLKSNR